MNLAFTASHFRLGIYLSNLVSCSLEGSGWHHLGRSRTRGGNIGKAVRRCQKRIRVLSSNCFRGVIKVSFKKESLKEVNEATIPFKIKIDA